MSISNSMKMIRDIRDGHYEQTKGMSQAQKDTYYRDKAVVATKNIRDTMMRIEKH